jgi:hypothetical protein
MIKYLTMIGLFLLTGCSSKQYDWVAEDGCGTVANAIAHYALGRDMHMDIGAMEASTEDGIKTCWQFNGVAECAIQSQKGIDQFKKEIQKVYSSTDSPGDIGQAFNDACLKEKGKTEPVAKKPQA